MSIFFIVADKRKNSRLEVTGDKYFADCTVSISHNFVNEVTEHAVEVGSNFSDHIEVKANTFNVSGVFNAQPLQRYLEDKLIYTNRIKEAYKFLTGLRNNRTVFTLVSKYDSYPNCVITNLSIPLDAETGNTLFFDMEIKQIKLAKVDQVAVVKTWSVKDSLVDTAKSTSSTGRSTTTETPMKSTALRIVQGAGAIGQSAYEGIQSLVVEGVTGTPVDTTTVESLVEGRK